MKDKLNPTQLEVLYFQEKPPKTLEERLDRVESKVAIMTIVNMYSQSHDLQDWDLFMNYVTDDIVRTITGSVHSQETGKKNLEAVYKRGQRMTRPDGTQVVYDPTIRRKHMVVTPVAKISDDGKMAWYSGYTSLASTKETPQGHVRSQHEALILLTFVREGGQWKVKRMNLNTELGHDPLRK